VPSVIASRPRADAPTPSPRSRPRPSVAGFAAWTPVLFGAAFLLYAVRAGLPAGSTLRAALAVLLTQVLPGALTWRCVRPVRGWWLEDLAMGFALGTAYAVAAQVVAGLARLPWLSAALPLALAVALLASPGSRRRLRAAQTMPLPIWWAPAVCAVTLVTVPQLQSYYRLVPLSWSAGARAPQVDTYLHLALAAELAHRGPERFPWVLSEPLGYHWFSHAWIAQVSIVSGTGLDEVLMRFMPAVIPLAVALSVGTAAVRLSGRAWAGPVAAVLALAGGDLNVFGEITPGYPVAPLSPSLGLGAPMVVGLVVVLAQRWRGQLRRGGYALVPVLAFAAAGTKGSTLPLVVAGLALAIAAAVLFDRSRVRPLLGDLAVVTACLLVALVVVFRGSGAGLRFDLVGAVREMPANVWVHGAHSAGARALVTGITVLGVLSRGTGLLALLASRARRKDPLTWLLLGGGLAGAGAVAAFSHPGASQYYFARTAGPLLALGSTLGLVALSDRLGRHLRLLLALGAVGGPAVALLPPAVLGRLTPGGTPRAALALLVVAAAVLAVVVATGAALSRGRRLAAGGATLALVVCAAGICALVAGQLRATPTPYAGDVALTRPLAVSRDQVDAARWIRAHSGVDDLVMTNRHCVATGPPRRCDSRRFVVAGFSERQVLLEGWTATPTSARLGPLGRDSVVVDYWKPELLALNDGFVAAPTDSGARRLRELGVRWVFVDATRPHAPTLEPFARLRFSTPGASVYELGGAAARS